MAGSAIKRPDFSSSKLIQGQVKAHAFTDELEKVKAGTLHAAKPSLLSLAGNPVSPAASKAGITENPDFAQLHKITEKYKFKLGNNGYENIDKTRLVIIFYGTKYQETVWPKYKFGLTMIGDGHGTPLTITLPKNTHYAQVQQFMQEVRNTYLRGERFASISIQSHGFYDGWVASEKGKKFPIQYNVFKEIADYEGEDAPFYLHARQLELAGCLTFGDLDADEIAYLRKLAHDNDVELIGNTTFSKGRWGKDEDGKDIKAEIGPGGDAYEFKSDGSIFRVLRPRDDETYSDTMKEKNHRDSSVLKNVWEAQFMQDSKLKASDFEIDERAAPAQMTYGSPGRETVVYYSLPIVYSARAADTHVAGLREK